MPLPGALARRRVFRHVFVCRGPGVDVRFEGLLDHSLDTLGAAFGEALAPQGVEKFLVAVGLGSGDFDESPVRKQAGGGGVG